MEKDLFSSIDLNLLRTLLILAQERNMRRAAERLFVTQPAVSQALKKLRHHFGDDLFVKSPNGMKSTPFCDELVDGIAPSLRELALALNAQRGFDPASLEGDLCIALSPHIQSYLSRPLFEAIRRQAADVRLQLVAWLPSTFDRIEKGDVDLGVTLDIERTRKEFMSQPLAIDTFTGYVRQGHPLKKDALSVADIARYNIASLIVPGWNDVEPRMQRLLQSHGERARVTFRSDDPNTILDIVRHTDLLYPSTRFIPARELESLRALEVRIDNRHIEYPLNAYYHQKDRRNPKTLWLVELLKTLLD